VGTSRAAPSNSATARAFLLRTIAAILLGLWLLGLVLDVVSALIHIVLVVGLIVLAIKLVSHVRSNVGRIQHFSILRRATPTGQTCRSGAEGVGFEPTRSVNP
jgi:hypothetical protein